MLKVIIKSRVDAAALKNMKNYKDISPSHIACIAAAYP